MVMGELTQQTDLVVIGGGPGGYAAAFRAADLGLDVTLVEAEPRCGGTCLLRGCIPSKALIQTAELILDAREAGAKGIAFDTPRIDLERLRRWKDDIIDRLTGGLKTLGEKRGVQILQARAAFENSETVRLEGTDFIHLRFRHAIVATGSESVALPGESLREGSRVMDSTGALNLDDIPQRLLVVGGGYIGLELGFAYAAFGSRVTVVNRGKRLLSAVDQDLVRPLSRRLERIFESILYETTLEDLKEHDDRVDVTLKGAQGALVESFDRVLVAIGRRPKTQGVGLENTRVSLDEKGFIRVDETRRTTDERIFAVGDAAGDPMLAHKAMREGKVAAEVIAGRSSAFDVLAIPAVVYTDPQVAWAGLTESAAQKQGIPVKVGRFPWGASGRALTMGAAEGLTKILFDPATGRMLGMGIVGRAAEAMIAEGVLAIEMGALAEDLALTIHAHPTLSETEGEAAEAFLGSATHLYVPRGK